MPQMSWALVYRSASHGQNTEAVREGRDGEFVSCQTQSERFPFLHISGADGSEFSQGKREAPR